MKTIFVMCGVPGAGQSNTVSELARIIATNEQNSVSVFTKNIDVPKKYYDSRTASMVEKRHEVYKWIQTATDNDYAIVDIPFLTAFDRADFIDEIVQAAERVGNKDLYIVAMYHQRSYHYLSEKYRGSDEKMSKDAQNILIRYMRRLQQPIRDEGFDLVYRIAGKDDMNKNQLSRMMFNMTEDPFWTTVDDERMVPVETTVEGDTITTQFAPADEVMKNEEN